MIHYVGELMLGEKVDITDPCYNKEIASGRMTVDCEPGLYIGHITMSDEGECGERVAAVTISKEHKVRSINRMECIGSISVDAGLAGFFNNKPDFSDDEWDDLCGQIEEGDAWNLYDGIFSISGYGDGCYDVYANKERNAFTIVFIEGRLR